MTQKTSYASLSMLAVLLFTACLQMGGESVQFSKAIPNLQSIALSTPSDALEGGVEGWGEDAATYYVRTVETTTRVNGSVDGLLEALAELVALEPTEQADGEAIWGPVTPEDSDMTSRLVVREVFPGRYHYEYLIRPATSTDDGDFLALISGNTTLDEEDDWRQGDLSLNWDAYQEVDPDFAYQGRMALVWDRSSSPARTVEVDYIGLVDRSGETVLDEPFNVTYRYQSMEDGSGEFQFAFEGNIHDETLPGLEMSQVRARWNETGAGRADVRITGDEITTELVEAGFEAEAIERGECWDATFTRTWYQDAPVGNEEGEATTCPYTTPLFADDDIVVM